MKGFSRLRPVLAWAGLVAAILLLLPRGRHKVASFQTSVTQFSRFLEARATGRPQRDSIHVALKKICERAEDGSIPESDIDRVQREFARAIRDDVLDSLEISLLVRELEGLPSSEGG